MLIYIFFTTTNYLLLLFFKFLKSKNVISLLQGTMPKKVVFCKELCLKKSCMSQHTRVICAIIHKCSFEYKKKKSHNAPLELHLDNDQAGLAARCLLVYLYKDGKRTIC